MQVLWFRCDVIIPSLSLGVLVVSLLIGSFFFWHEIQHEPDTERNCNMAEAAQSNWERYRAEGHQAFILGYTGEVGKELIKELAAAKLFKKVVLIGRRQVDLDTTVGPEFEQKVVDFEKLEEHSDVFEGLDTGFCALGTTRGKSGVKGFVRVDHDYVLISAEIAKARGCKHFSLVSSQGANKNSSMLYTRTKGQVEEALKVMHFDRISIYRPGVLMCDRTEDRPGEKVARVLLKPISYLFPTAITTPTEIVAKALVNNVVAPSERTQELYENKAIHQLSGTSKACGTQSNQESSKSK
ncbi:oxidoreductase HTATIP2-like isoform X1 [Haliotis rufescens]|uniref:oxidoreductase HTATIP2-like isoform X1 n=1 Tax=Haliotis rufescens TaxID=6454 RepID=UPI001EB05E46|nr:oxidoreductase HTATIP2-like isoform X1 [Haliotis rufescens]